MQKLLSILPVFLTTLLFSQTPDLKKFDDGDHVTFRGTLTGIEDNTLKVSYNDRTILVEVDGYHNRAPKGLPTAEELKANKSEVIISGRMDKDGKEANRSIEARTVHFVASNETIYANSDDEEEVLAGIKKGDQKVAQITGRVTHMTTVGRQFTVATALGETNVDVRLLKENPFDDSGKIQIAVGDQVTVQGILDNGFTNKGPFKALKIEKRSQ